MNMKNIIVVVFCLGLSGCISIEIPDTIVSDSVEAGKNAYHEIKKELRDDGNYVKTFTHVYQIQQDEKFSVASGNCINAAVEKAQKKLDVQVVKINKAVINHMNKAGKPVLECDVIIAK